MPLSPVNLNQRDEIHWASAWQFALSALAIFGLWSGVIILSTVGIAGLSVRDSTFVDPLQMFLITGTLAVTGILLLPSAVYSLRRLLGKPPRKEPIIWRSIWPSLWILIFPGVLLLGYWSIGSPELTWLILPPLHVLAVGLPVGWILYLAVKDLPLGSPQRMWGVFGSGLALAPALILIAEGLAVFIVAILGIMLIASQPDLMVEINSLAEWLLESNPSSEEVIEALTPYLMNPMVILSVLFFGAVIVPVIEEALKPIGVWLLVGRCLSPGAGFAAGTLSGAGYALFESLVLTVGGEEWVPLVVARVGTSAVHILTAGMTGWALALAWQRSRYANLGLAYLGAVFIHGLWNGATLIYSFATMAEIQRLSIEPLSIFKLGEFAPYGLAFLSISAFMVLIIVNRLLAARIGKRAEKSAPDKLLSDGPNESVL